MHRRIIGALGASLLLTPLALAQTSASGSADLILRGGAIVTVNDRQPKAEAVAIRNGAILAVGDDKAVLKLQGPNTKVINLAGKTLMPGFIDGHAHAMQFGAQAVGANLLAPPDGKLNSIDDMVEKLKAFGQGPDGQRTGWIFGLGYDDALLGRHPTRADLDKASTTVPVMAMHISGHFAAVNTAGLKLIGYDASTPNPGGVSSAARPTARPRMACSKNWPPFPTC
jgi:predicted amidohydrolase YtcJ